MAAGRHDLGIREPVADHAAVVVGVVDDACLNVGVVALGDLQRGVAVVTVVVPVVVGSRVPGSLRDRLLAQPDAHAVPAHDFFVVIVDEIYQQHDSSALAQSGSHAQQHVRPHF